MGVDRGHAGRAFDADASSAKPITCQSDVSYIDRHHRSLKRSHMLPPRKDMSDTFSFASRLCKFVILLVILLIGGASLYLWWLGRPYQDAMSAFVPLLMPMLVLVLAFDTFRALARTRR
ncbi:hypothetical protein PA14OR_2551 [Pseudomonas aeruginosa]|jgi:hypothetical protein|uniref:Transmembrane protein n=2 Tax=Pseudomonas aeruginosa TaxID=287 RepID=A0A0H2ZAL5_PSEAB|nr:hypothetical protein PA14_31340 [Pseudomonas aeruginosa UCBPP-PA14]AHB55699.1 hypothetical protein U769_12370 [Pseudomonas aeruginosa MTB-1]EQL40348.1 hypothetical protein M770_17295 [Pseudomonas aeruginosa VRFPA03]KAJ07057.1 hypothetical protein M002_27780 [Pseudomonas aeruginosa ID4365]MCL7570928.1 hypothetical protein [Staphylococcus aureus]CDH77044.1 hypothetical protein PAMH27_2649 [Pseudomonas aeruginosa MH27]SCM62446.1 hypothetical protein PA14OR_2551 [Pseudomonas aeruginosa]